MLKNPPSLLRYEQEITYTDVADLWAQPFFSKTMVNLQADPWRELHILCHILHFVAIYKTLRNIKSIHMNLGMHDIKRNAWLWKYATLSLGCQQSWWASFQFHSTLFLSAKSIQYYLLSRQLHSHHIYHLCPQFTGLAHGLGSPSVRLADSVQAG